MMKTGGKMKNGREEKKGEEMEGRAHEGSSNIKHPQE
jgi:hypothetical protein